MSKLTGHINPLEDKPRSKCRLWELVVNLPYDGTRYPRRTRRFHGSYREACAALRDFLDELERASDPTRVTFSEFARDWHRRRERSGMYADATMRSELTRIRAALQYLGARELSTITTADIEECYTAMPWSPKSIEGMHKTLTTLFNDAVRTHVIDSAPTSGAKRPQVHEATRNVPDALAVDNMVAALDMDNATHRAIALCACCGLRREESVALYWSDFADGCVTIARACNLDGTTKPTKSGKPRTVPVPASLLERLPIGGAGRVADIRPDALTRWWTRHRASFGMDGVRLHDLRHAYLTRLAAAGVHPRVMMELAGHSSIDVCMNIYTHVDDAARRDAVARAFD